jgi:hypothetical protein
MEYQKAVAEARQLRKRSEEDQWRLAQLTYEQVESGVTRTRWAEDIGYSSPHAGRLYTVWQQYGDRADRPSFYECYERVKEPGKYEGQEDISSRHQASARAAVRNMEPEQRAEIVREALEDPVVAEHVVRDNHARAQISRSERKVDDERQTTAKERYELEYPQSVEIGDMIDLEHALSKARIAAEDALSAADRLEVRGWPENSRERAAVLAQRAATAVELVQAKVGTSIDEELAALMEGER